MCLLPKLNNTINANKPIASNKRLNGLKVLDLIILTSNTKADNHIIASNINTTPTNLLGTLRKIA